MSLARLIVLGAVVLGANPLTAAPVCVLNLSGQPLFLVVDNLAGQRISGVIADQNRLCLAARAELQKALVGVFASSDVLEGCSRLTRPDQVETLLEFKEFDNCRWEETDRDLE